LQIVQTLFNRNHFKGNDLAFVIKRVAANFRVQLNVFGQAVIFHLLLRRWRSFVIRVLHRVFIAIPISLRYRKCENYDKNQLHIAYRKKPIQIPKPDNLPKTFFNYQLPIK
jgi:hypothetical protein